MNPTFDIRRPTIGARHSTVGDRRLRKRRHPTFNSRLSVVGCHSAVDRRMSNVVRYSFSDATKGTLTAQESVGATQENAVTTQEGAPKTTEGAPKDTEVTPKDASVAPKIAPKGNGVAPKDKEIQESAVKSAVKNLVNNESVVEKCVTLWGFLKEDPQRTITNAVERLSCSRRSIVTYIGILKQAKVLEHVGPYRGGGWKFLI